MGIMDAIKKGFSVATKNLTLILILFLFNLIWNLASIPLARPGAAATPPVTTAAIILSLLFIIGSIFVQGGALAMIRDYMKEGKMKLGSFAGSGMKYFLRLFGLGLLIILIIAIIGLVAALIVAATAALRNTAVTIVATIIAIIVGAVGLYYIFLLIMSPYSLVCEDLSIIGSMKRSVGIVRGAIGRVILLLILLVLISLGIGFLIGFLTGLLTMALPAGAGQVVVGVVNSAFNGYLGVVMMTSFMALYFGIVEKGKTAAQKVV
jgi:hypothetical protein